MTTTEPSSRWIISLSSGIGRGVVVTTTTHTANGKVIVTHVRHSTYRDN